MPSLNTLDLSAVYWVRPTIGGHPASWIHAVATGPGPLGYPALCGVIFSNPGPRIADAPLEERCPDCQSVLKRLAIRHAGPAI